MQTNPQPYRYTGLLAIMGLAALLAGLIIMLLLPEIRLAAWGVMGVGVILLASAFVLDFRRVRSALTGRRGRFSTGTTLMASIFIGITLLINGISINFYQRIDATALSQFTLTTQTKDVLSALAKPVKALCFFVPEKDTYGITTYAAVMLMEYQNYTEKLTIEFIDPDEHPDRARQYQIIQYQTVVFECEGQYRLVPPMAIIQFSEEGVPISVEAEHAFTSAILEVTGTVQKKVYFLTGHGEADINGNYGYVRNGLRDDLYVTGTLNLITDPTIPDDCAVLIIAAPQTALTTSEIDIIDRYLKAGGQAMILTDPNYPDGLAQLVSPWGVDLSNGTVIDTASSVAPRKDMPLVTGERNFFSITSGLDITAYFPGAIGIIPQEKAPADTEMQPLVYTSSNSWLEKDYDPTKEPAFDDGRDVKGPVALGVVIAAAPRDTSGQSSSKIVRLVVIGDSDFASNQHFLEVNNSDLFLNSVSWLAEETELIAIRRTVTPFRRLAVNPDEANFINYSSLALPPILVLVIGGIIWWRRR